MDGCQASAVTSRAPSSPKAFAICDRCGFLYNHEDLNWQMQWAGDTLINQQILVCNPCLDVPQDQLRSLTLPPDPEPVSNPRPEYYAIDDSNWLVTEAGVYFITEDGVRFITEAVN